MKRSSEGELENMTSILATTKTSAETTSTPILIAGAGPNILTRVVALGDGWMPVFAMEWHPSLAGKQTPHWTRLPKYVAELNASVPAAAGKSSPTISAMGLPPTPAYVDLLQENGVERMVLGFAA